MEITTVIGCGINCEFCPQNKLIKKYNERNAHPITVLMLQTFKECVNKIPKRVRIDFSGMAEPWLNKKCTEMVLYASEKGHSISVYTTLVGMTEDDFDKIKNIKYCNFAIHIPDSLTHSNIPITQNYLKLLGKILKNPPPKLDSGLEVFCYGPVHPALSSIVNVKPSDVQDRAGNLDDPNTQHYCIGGPICCRYGGRNINRNVLLPDGTVLLCSMDYSMEHILGDLTKVKYKDLFKSKEALKILKSFDDETISLLCRKCFNASRYNFYKETFKSLFRH